MRWDEKALRLHHSLAACPHQRTHSTRGHRPWHTWTKPPTPNRICQRWTLAHADRRIQRGCCTTTPALGANPPPLMKMKRAQGQAPGTEPARNSVGITGPPPAPAHCVSTHETASTMPHANASIWTCSTYDANSAHPRGNTSRTYQYPWAEPGAVHLPTPRPHSPRTGSTP